MLKVLVTDDQEHVLDALEILFEMRGGLEVLRACGPEEALERIRGGGVGIVVHDMNFTEGTTSGDEGVALFRRIRELDPQMPVILMTAWASLESAVDLVKQGADDYLQKPWDDEALLKKVTNLLRAREHQLGAEERGAAPSHEASAPPKADHCGLLFRSAAMHSVVSLAVKVAASNVPVLILGPNGAGKEKIAEIIQANSARRAGPFVKVNVGALPDELFAAELFGAEAGAFTGARARRTGRFEAADGGTLFLDEMGNLSLESQAKLLRALQSGEFERLGSNQPRKADVRVVAATNADMRAAIADGRFREDLYYRLAVIELEVPPLGARKEDILPLARAFAEQFGRDAIAPIGKVGDSVLAGEKCASAAPRDLASQTPPIVFDDSFSQALYAYDWPGNVRELQNRVRRALLMAEGGVLRAEHLGLGAGSVPPAAKPLPVESTSAPTLARGVAASCAAATSPSSLERAERETIEQALNEADYVISRAASSLGLSRQALYRRMQRLGIRLKREVE